MVGLSLRHRACARGNLLAERVDERRGAIERLTAPCPGDASDEAGDRQQGRDDDAGFHAPSIAYRRVSRGAVIYGAAASPMGWVAR